MLTESKSNFLTQLTSNKSSDFLRLGESTKPEEPMAVYDPHFGGYRIFIGDLGQRTSRYDIEKEYERYGKLLDVWVAR